MIHFASQTALSWYWLWHPLFGPGYQFYSGVASDISEITLLGGLVAVLKHRNCHQKGCWRLGHNHPEHGFPTCRRHYRRELEA